MGFIFNGLSGQEVSISLDTTTLGTVLCISGTRAKGAGTTTLGTVGAGKVWYIVGISMGATADNIGSTTHVKLNDVTFLRCAPASAAVSTAAANDVTYPYPFACPVLTAGQTVKLETEANCNGWASVSYVEATAP